MQRQGWKLFNWTFILRVKGEEFKDWKNLAEAASGRKRN